jgi:hypothetical protein
VDRPKARGPGTDVVRHDRAVAALDLVDETFVVAPPEVVAGIVADPASWRRWWPDLHLVVFMDRGLAGQRWSMTGALVGSLEIWIEPFADGCILHHYLRGEPSDDGRTPRPWPDTPAGWRAAAAERARRATAWKASVWDLKYRLEGDRRAGVPPDWATANDGARQPEQ